MPSTIEKKAFLLALFAGRDRYLSADYLEEKLDVAFNAKSVGELVAPLDEENRIRFNDFIRTLKR